jgi:hypothetical protein
MVSIGQRTLDVVNLHNSGMPIVDIAKELSVSPSNVEERLRTYRRFKSGKYGQSGYVKPNIWETKQIKEGFDRFIGLHGRLPTADEIDSLVYLPSSRQIQRRYGGLMKLREQLGYEDTHFGKGDHRSRIQKSSRVRGNEAEIKMYKWLVNKFGEPFVHSEKEYGDLRNRADFLIYAEGITIGIDVFATDTLKTLRKNVDIKAKKYINFPKNLPLLFIAWGSDFSDEDIKRVCRVHLVALPNLRVLSAKHAFDKLYKINPLTTPQEYTPMINDHQYIDGNKNP